jgi:hypothetical protein
MFNFSKAIFAAVIVLAGVATVFRGPARTFQDQSGTWHRNAHTRGPAIAVPPVYVVPFKVQEQQRLDVAEGNVVTDAGNGVIRAI